MFPPAGTHDKGAPGRARDPGNPHAAKVYRKTFAIQRDALAFRPPAPPPFPAPTVPPPEVGLHLPRQAGR